MTDTSADDTRARKQALRERLLARRRAFDRDDLALASRRLIDHVVADPLWREARGFAAFVGVRGEVDTRALLECGLAQAKTLYLPRVLGGGQMAFWPCADLDALERGRMGLREPAAIGEGVDRPGREHGVDLIFVPGLGFSPTGARIGFGAGHYDRAFAPWLDLDASLDPGARPTLIGVCPEAFVELEIPTAAHDLTMDALATDAGLRRVSATPQTR